MLEYILVIDDDEDFLNYLIRVLEKEKYKVIFAKDGKEGLKLLHDYPVWATIVDDQLPIMSGLEFLKNIKYEYPNIINILITGQHNMETIIQCLNLNLIYKYFSKPIDEDELIATLEEIQILFELKKRAITSHKNLGTEAQLNPDIPVELLKIYDKFFTENFKIIQLGQFSLSLLKQIQNPLNIIKLNVNFMEKNKRYSEVALKQIKLGLNSIQDTLTLLMQYFSKNVSRKKEIIHLSEFISKCINTTRSLLKNADKFQFRVDIQSSLEKIYFNAAHLEQILNTLLQNGIEASYSREKPEIGIKIYSDYSYFYLHVTDNGSGIKKEFHSKIFDPFFSTKDKNDENIWIEGTPKMGLGLWLIYHIIKEYKGDMEFKTSEKGTEFTVKIPLKKVLLNK